MKFVGFTFTKLNAEKSGKPISKLSINNNVNILQISQSKEGFLKTKEPLLKFDFNYGIEYKPDVAKINLEGSVLALVDSKIAKAVLKEWKDKKVHEEIRDLLFNFILKKATLKALELEDALSLPAHLPLPSIRFSKDSGSKSAKK